MSLSYIIGLDLGQAADYSALSVVEKSEVPEPGAEQCRFPPLVSSYAVRQLHRWRLGTPYPQIVSDVAALTRKPPLAQSAVLVIDATGVGKAVVDQFHEARLAVQLVPVTITGLMMRAAPSPDGGWHTPKKDLVAVMQTLIQASRFHIVPSLKEAKILGAELEQFRVKVTTAGNETFEALRQRDHDDLVLSVALACWHGERGAECRVEVIDMQAMERAERQQLAAKKAATRMSERDREYFGIPATPEEAWRAAAVDAMTKRLASGLPVTDEEILADLGIDPEDLCSWNPEVNWPPPSWDTPTNQSNDPYS